MRTIESATGTRAARPGSAGAEVADVTEAIRMTSRLVKAERIEDGATRFTCELGHQFILDGLAMEEVDEVCSGPVCGVCATQAVIR